MTKLRSNKKIVNGKDLHQFHQQQVNPAILDRIPIELLLGFSATILTSEFQSSQNCLSNIVEIVDPLLREGNVHGHKSKNERFMMQDSGDAIKRKGILIKVIVNYLYIICIKGTTCDFAAIC